MNREDMDQLLTLIDAYSDFYRLLCQQLRHDGQVLPRRPLPHEARMAKLGDIESLLAGIEDQIFDLTSPFTARDVQKALNAQGKTMPSLKATACLMPFPANLAALMALGIGTCRTRAERLEIVEFCLHMHAHRHPADAQTAQYWTAALMKDRHGR